MPPKSFVHQAPERVEEIFPFCFIFKALGGFVIEGIKAPAPLIPG
jgi:hypothetical protein